MPLVDLLLSGEYSEQMLGYERSIDGWPVSGFQRCMEPFCAILVIHSLSLESTALGDQSMHPRFVPHPWVVDHAAFFIEGRSLPSMLPFMNSILFKNTAAMEPIPSPSTCKGFLAGFSSVGRSLLHDNEDLASAGIYTYGARKQQGGDQVGMRMYMADSCSWHLFQGSWLSFRAQIMKMESTTRSSRRVITALLHYAASDLFLINAQLHLETR
jgi:hypothetical protein